MAELSGLEKCDHGDTSDATGGPLLFFFNFSRAMKRADLQYFVHQNVENNSSDAGYGQSRQDRPEYTPVEIEHGRHLLTCVVSRKNNRLRVSIRASVNPLSVSRRR